ncbi:FprA family A-type flavoprotein [Methanocella sp. MCL-LM]|uniref:FprA family A-type flavoprotein n=1 Tax=Methanocella sp. MCL-LM TaxID=3412035 RepID=UPI003C7637DB
MKTEIRPGIYWVGAIDWDLRDFHGYTTPKGSTYNAYLIVDEKVALVDTVKEPFKDELLSRISEILDPARIDYLIVNHLERDHFGSFAGVMEVAKNAQVYSGERGSKGIVDVYGERWPVTAVKTGSTLSLGKKTLRFVETPMLHWPDSMMTYLEEDKVLLSSDAFGQHVASSERFDRDASFDPLDDAKIYYANILMPFSMLIQGLLGKLPGLNLNPEVIAPDHGIIWTDPGKIIEAYGRWSKFEARPKVVIAYDTMWGSTEKMAHLLAEGVMDEGGVEVKFYNIRKSTNSEIVSEIQDAKAVLLGSATLNNGIFPPVGGFLYYLKGLRPQKKIAMGFGSFGWMGGAVKEITARLKETDMEVLDGLEIRYPATKAQVEQCRETGRMIARKVKGGQ